MKVVYDSTNKFRSSVDRRHLKCYNEKRSQANLPPISTSSLIHRDDPLLIEVIESSLDYCDSLRIAIVPSGEYTIIVENNTEVVIDDPITVVNQLYHNLRTKYYHSDNTRENIEIECQKILARIVAIINTYP